MNQHNNQRPMALPEGRSWWRGFAARMLLSTSALVLAVILVTSAFSYQALREMSLKVAAQALQGEANVLRHDLESRVHSLQANLRELAGNALVANALVDDVGRDIYLRDFIGGFTMAEGFDLTLAMTSFRGNIIATNRPDASLLMPPAWAAEAVTRAQDGGHVMVHEGIPYLLLIEPIIYRNTGMAEGALIFQVNLANWLNFAVVNGIFNEAPWLASLSLEHAEGTASPHIYLAIRGTETVDAPHIRQAVSMPEAVTGVPLSIHLTAKASFVQSPLDELLTKVAVLSGAVFLAALAGGIILARTQTRKLARLRSEAGRITQAKFQEASFTSDNRDEIDDLAEAFTTLVEELQRAYRQLEDQSQREIEKRERHYHAIIDNSAEGIITISKSGAIETFNPSAEKIFGYKAVEVQGRNVSMLMPENEREAHDAYLRHSGLNSPRIINRARDLFGLRKDGRVFPIELNVSPMDVDGVRKYIGILRDISERKEFEERLNAARVEAEQANLAKSKFLSSMSHELRTPLNAILGFGQLLDMDGKTPLVSSQKEAVSQILKGGRHLLELIDQVLNLARIESGNMTISLEAIEVAPLLADSLAMARAMAERRNIRLDRDFPDHDGVFIRADRTRLQQILLNLLSNAIKYNVPGGSVTLGYKTLGDEACRFEVKDTGPGIPEHLKDKVFVPFNRLGAEGSGVEGTGIGLTITRELVRMMDGDIGFISVPGEGTTFWFDLPLSHEAANLHPASAGEHGEAVTLPAIQQGRVYKVLYVEDNPSNLQLMEMVFSRDPNIRLLTAENAETGLAVAERERPDLVLMDINLPGMSGVDALRAMRGNAKTSAIPVIAVSANAMERDIQETLKAGFLAYLTKPLNIQNVIATVHDVLERTQAPRGH